MLMFLLSAAPAEPTSGATPPYLGSCRRIPVQTCYDWFATGTATAAEPAVRCELLSGAFTHEPCPAAGATGRCDLPEVRTTYYGRTTTPGFGLDIPVDALCVQDKGSWADVAPSAVPLTTDDGRVTIVAPPGWTTLIDRGAFDLRLVTVNNTASLGVFVYPSETTDPDRARRLLAKHVEQFASTRQRWAVVEPEKRLEFKGSTATVAVYTGSLKTEALYWLAAVAFEASPTVLVAVGSMDPGVQAAQQPVFEQIVGSLALAATPPNP